MICILRITCGILISFLPIHLAASQLLTGDSSAPTGASLSFPVQVFALNGAHSNMYSGAAPLAINANEFAINVANKDAGILSPLASETVTVNNVVDQPSPLYNQPVQLLTVVYSGGVTTGRDEIPTAVLSSDLKTLYLEIVYTSTTFNVISVTNLPDATGAPTQAIAAIQGSSAYVAAMVNPASGSFGQPGTGLVLVRTKQTSQETTVDGKKVTTYDQFAVVIDATTGLENAPGGNKALPFDITSPFLTINGNLTSLNSPVIYINQINRSLLFVGAQAQAGPGASDGVKAVALAGLGQNLNISLFPIVDNNAIAGNTEIIAALGANEQVSILDLQTMISSTHLYYLIVHGGNGDAIATANQMYALPLVNSASTVAQQIAIADKNQIPVNGYNSDGSFVGPALPIPATTPAGMTQSTDIAARIGGGPLVAGPISYVNVVGDTVFASVDNPIAGQQPGIYFSQALFDDTGKIRAWTQWQYAVGVYGQKIPAFSYDPTTALYTFFVDNGGSAGINTAKRTQWLTGDQNGLAPLQNHIATVIASLPAGVQGLFDIPATTPGSAANSQLIVMGKGTVLLAVTGEGSTDLITPVGGVAYDPIDTNEDGTFASPFPDTTGPTSILVASVSGGDLDAIDNISTAALGYLGTPFDSFLFVGGTGGLAVLSGPAGEFAGNNPIPVGFSFKRIGDYSFIRKLIADDTYLYVLTDDRLDRISLTPAIGLGIFTATTIATIDTMPGVSAAAFLDVITSDQLGLLATGQGLFRVGDGVDVRTVTVPSQANWTLVPTPDGSGIIHQLLAISSTGRSQDIAKTQGGALYVLDSFQGKNHAWMYRFNINPVDTSQVSSLTVQPYNDMFVQNQFSYFANLNGYKNIIATDGSAYFMSAPRDGRLPFSFQLFGGIYSGFRFGAFLTTSSIPLAGVAPLQLTALERNAGSGSWLVSGNFGLYINE